MRALIIGFGHSGRAYLNACRAIGGFDAIHLTDIDPIAGSDLPEDVSFSTDLPKDKYDLAVVATPPASHLEVLSKVAPRMTKTIVEKPFAISIDEINEIFSLAASCGSIFFSIHARYGKELSMAQKRTQHLFGMGTACVTQIFCDPYWPDGPKNLGGPYWDSIFNALGILNELFPEVQFDDVMYLVDRAECCDVLCIGSHHYGSLRYRLTVDWSRGLNVKLSEISFGMRQVGVLINHNQQCISALSGLEFEHEPFQQPRLASHYKAVVAECLSITDMYVNNYFARRISDQVLQIVVNKKVI